MEMLSFSKKAISQDEKILKLLKRKGIDINKARSSIIFDKDCIARRKNNFNIKR